ncbi:MAG: hypothetical protein EDM82_12615 [Cyanobacteria bacterium CYA]|nr:MAG: hypothetical protein EDM82_12615 [Cyanobacteria bacterium CYA]
MTYCFTQGHGDFSGTTPDDEDSVQAREARFFSMAPSLLTAYLTRLFESPSFVAERYTDNQIAEATWFIFGCGSGYIGDMRRGTVSPDLQVRCVRSIATLYTDLFDRVCGHHGTDPDSDLRDTDEVDGAVYMMWDMGHLEGTVMFPEKGPHLVEPGIEVLESVLHRCRTSACRVSALHGIGHIYCIHNYQGDKAIASRLRAIVDAFTERNDLPEWLRDYAAHAREGYVQ